MNHLLGVVVYILLLLIAVLAMYDFITGPESKQLFIYRLLDIVVYLTTCISATFYPCAWWIWEHARTFGELFIFWLFIAIAHFSGTYFIAGLFNLFKMASNSDSE